MTEQPIGPRCGNNPNVQLTPGDRKAVEDFKAYLADRAALRDRIAEAQYAHDHPGHLVPLDQTGMGPAYRAAADAVLAVLPDRAAALREAEAEAEAERQLATVQRVRQVLELEPVLNRTALEYRGLIISALMSDEAQQPETEPAAGVRQDGAQS